MLRSMERITRTIGLRAENIACWVAGVSGGLLFCFSPVLWSQSTIVEVYALNAFFMVFTVLLLYRWMCRPQENNTLYLLAFIFGLGLTNHQALLFMAPALLVAIAFRDQPLFRDSLAGVFWMVAAVLFAMMYKAGPASTPEALRNKQTMIALGLIFMAAPVGLFMIERKLMTEWKRVLILAGMAALGLSFYAYLPFSSEQNPPMNWGYPRTQEGFIHAVSRGQYEKIDAAVNMHQAIADPAYFWRMLHDVVFDPGGYVSVVVQFTWGIALFAGLALIFIPGLLIYHLTRNGRPWREALGQTALIWFIGLAALTVVPLLFIALVHRGLPGARAAGGDPERHPHLHLHHLPAALLRPRPTGQHRAVAHHHLRGLPFPDRDLPHLPVAQARRADPVHRARAVHSGPRRLRHLDQLWAAVRPGLSGHAAEGTPPAPAGRLRPGPGPACGARAEERLRRPIHQPGGQRGTERARLRLAVRGLATGRRARHPLRNQRRGAGRLPQSRLSRRP
jgi:hypothetical protein